MTPAARIAAAIELLDAIVAAARDGGPAADTLIAAYFRTRRYAGSKDRRAVRALVYDVIRRSGERPDSGRSAMLGLVGDRPELAALFDGSAHGPAPIVAGEAATPASAAPAWILPLLAAPVDISEQAALLERAPLDARVNRLKATRAAILPMLPEAEPIAFLPDALRLPEGYALEQSEAHQAGLVEVQDAGSQLIVAACAARAGQMVIDLCAGAGGKTLALAAAMGAGMDDVGRLIAGVSDVDRLIADIDNVGRLIAADVNRERLSRLPPRAERAGAGFIETLLLDQGHEHRGLDPLAGTADIVLIDAPCSGTGTWRRNPEARWRLTPARLDRLVAEQARIIDLAAALVRPGGALVYAVCALTDREGRAQVEAFLSRAAGWGAEPLVREIGVGRPWGPGLLLTPGHDGTDGFFFARLVKS